MQKGRGKTLTGMVGCVTAEVVPWTRSQEPENSVEHAGLDLDQVFEILKNYEGRGFSLEASISRYTRDVSVRRQSDVQ